MPDPTSNDVKSVARALNRLASAQEEIGKQLRIQNMLAAAAFDSKVFKTPQSRAKALHRQAIDQIGVKP